MDAQSLLVVEADNQALYAVDRPLRERIPGIDLHVSKSVEEAAHRLQSFRYDTIIASIPFLLECNQHLLHTKRALHATTPLIVTVGKSDRRQAHEILQTGSFSILTKPIDPGEAVKSVRLALWQNRLLKLIASREKALAAFREHIKKFPEDWRGEELFARSLALMEKTLTALGTSLQRMEETHDPYLYDIAVSIDLRSRQRALDRLFRLASEGAVHQSLFPALGEHSLLTLRFPRSLLSFVTSAQIRPMSRSWAGFDGGPPAVHHAFERFNGRI